MKIALISVHNDPNYGSALQAYALAYAIKREGFDCEYLNYTPVPSANGVKNRIKGILKSILVRVGYLEEPKSEYSFWRTPEFQQQRQLFSAFHDKMIPFSSRKYDSTCISQANHFYDMFIVGSDQTWSPYVTKQLYNINFLDFVEFGKLKGSYAPSFGTCYLTEDYKEKLKEKIACFHYLSCREKHNADELTKYFKRNVEYVLDPTLLVSSEEWKQISSPISIPKRYILCYILGTKQCISDFAEHLGKEQGVPVYYIVTRPEYRNKKNALKDVSPEQFITLVSNAECMITDSFHGSLFSITFKCQFYAFTKRSPHEGAIDNDRIGDFLEVLGLSERLKNDNDFSINSDIDYNHVSEVLSSLRSTSIGYLQKLLSRL